MKRLMLCLISVFAAAGMFLLTTGTTLACCGGGPPPLIEEVIATPDQLWPPNHKMVEVLLEVNGQNIDNWYVSGVAIANQGAGEGDPLNDPDYVYDGQYLLLRSERSGKAGARIYTVTVTATNSSGVDTAWVQLTVPHDQSG